MDGGVSKNDMIKKGTEDTGASQFKEEGVNEGKRKKRKRGTRKRTLISRTMAATTPSGSLGRLMFLWCLEGCKH
jgi:hypothetical protein